MEIVVARVPRAVEFVELPPGFDHLPPFPAVALRALNVLAGTDTSLRELCDLIRPDAVFSAEILRIANSPLVAFSKEITSVLQASMLLGFRRLRRVVITVGLRSYLDRELAPLLQSCWRHSVACGMCAERAARWNSIDRDLAYTAGILHDIGRVALATIGPASYAGLIGGENVECEGLHDERELFGIDHCQAGCMLVTAWKLPQEFTAVTSHHHDPLTHVVEDLAEVIRLSCRLADALGFAVSRKDSLYTYDEVLAEYPESVRSHLPSADELTAEIGREISVIETT
jgi:putative nucleotidyltransferase with HDIG domain